MKCTNCGKEIKDGVKFCNYCGARLSVDSSQKMGNVSGSSTVEYLNCPMCNFELNVEDESCSNCEIGLSYICGGCNQDFTYGELILNEGHCPHCGAYISNLPNIPNEKYPYYKALDATPNTNEVGQGTQNENTFLKYVKYAALAYIAYLLFGFFFGNSHKCVGRWEGSFLRPSDSSTRETWVVKINSDGSCEGSEIGSGSFDYEVDYTHGEWHAVSDDVIYVELTGDAHTTRTTYSNAEVDKELAKAQTPWAKHEAYKRTSGTKLQVSSNKSFFYLRRDGTVSSSMDFSYPRMVLSKR